MMSRALPIFLGFAACTSFVLYDEDTISARAEAAIIGAFCADASAMPLHWIYSVQEIAQLVGSGNPEFFNPPSCPFYTYKEGWGTPYGQQGIVYLTQGSSQGNFDPLQIQALYYDQYKAGSIAKKENWYFDASTKEFVANVAGGATYPNSGGNDDQADSVTHIIPVVAMYAGNTSAMLEAAKSTIYVTQATTGAIAFGSAAARVLEYLFITNMTGYEAVNATIADLQDPARLFPNDEDAALAAGLVSMLAQVNVSNMDICLSVGQSCDYPFNLWTGSHLIAQLGDSQADFISGIRQTILAGGDSGSRSMYVGAAQAARMGSASLIPSEWTSKTLSYAAVAQMAAELVAKRPAAARRAAIDL